MHIELQHGRVSVLPCVSSYYASVEVLPSFTDELPAAAQDELLPVIRESDTEWEQHLQLYELIAIARSPRPWPLPSRRPA